LEIRGNTGKQAEKPGKPIMSLLRDQKAAANEGSVSPVGSAEGKRPEFAGAKRAGSPSQGVPAMIELRQRDVPDLWLAARNKGQMYSNSERNSNPAGLIRRKALKINAFFFVLLKRKAATRAAWGLFWGLPGLQFETISDFV
jgi:hypothetical protein